MEFREFPYRPSVWGIQPHTPDGQLEEVGWGQARLGRGREGAPPRRGPGRGVLQHRRQAQLAGAAWRSGSDSEWWDLTPPRVTDQTPRVGVWSVVHGSQQF